jgi:hypoxanthine phosphoribosyltransferase
MVLLPPTNTELRDVLEKAECIYTSEDIDKALDSMAKAITERLSDSRLLVLCTMIGGMIPTVHLLSRLSFPVEVDYVHATRYGNEREGSSLEWRAKPHTPLKGRTVLIVDDILDRGLTLAAIKAYVEEEKAAAVYTAVVLDKQEVRLDDGLAEADFTGLKVANHFLFGFGLDYKRHWRNLPAVYKID